MITKFHHFQKNIQNDKTLLDCNVTNDDKILFVRAMFEISELSDGQLPDHRQIASLRNKLDLKQIELEKDDITKDIGTWFVRFITKEPLN